MENFFLLSLGFVGAILVIKATIFWEKEEQAKAIIAYIWGVVFLFYVFFKILVFSVL